MSVMIMSAMVLVMIFTLGISVFFSRFSVLESEQKRLSLALAEACANTAMLKAAQNSAYTPPFGGECVGVSDTCGVAGATRTCRICSVSQTAGTYTIRTRAVYKGAYSAVEFRGTLGASAFTVSSWREIAPYTGSVCTLP